MVVLDGGGSGDGIGEFIGIILQERTLFKGLYFMEDFFEIVGGSPPCHNSPVGEHEHIPGFLADMDHIAVKGARIAF